jgi:hypothetical protein
VIAVNDLLKLAIDGHGGLPRLQQITRFRAAASITGAIWTLKGQPGLLDGVVLAGETRDQRLTITPFPRPGRYATWEPYRQDRDRRRRAGSRAPRPRRRVRRDDPVRAVG